MHPLRHCLHLVLPRRSNASRDHGIARATVGGGDYCNDPHLDHAVASFEGGQAPLLRCLNYASLATPIASPPRELRRDARERRGDYWIAHLIALSPR